VIWQKLMQTGLAVWLTADLDTISARLAKDSATDELRPSLTGEDIHREIGSVLASREPLYRKGSHIVIDTAENSLDEIVSLIERALAGKASQNRQS